MRTDFPKSSEVDHEAFQRDLSLHRAETNYVVFFTPRAGSSWLTDILKQTGRMGRPDECFNPRHLNKLARAVNASSLEDYAQMLARKRQTHGVSGFEITHHQLRAVFKTNHRFRALFPEPAVFWLTRKDIVAQAVSLYKMTQTRVSHTTEISATDIAIREAQFTYSADLIQHWINHILLAEQRTEALISEAGWRPMRLWYEWNMEVGAQVTINRMAEFLGLPRIQKGAPPQSGHKKIATGKNAEFAERFATERAAFLEDVATKRAPMLAKLRPYRQQLNSLSAEGLAA